MAGQGGNINGEFHFHLWENVGKIPHVLLKVPLLDKCFSFTSPEMAVNVRGHGAPW